MGKRDKAPPGNDGRVPLVEGGKPLLYPRYNSVEELLNIGKNSATENGNAAAGAEVEVAERPSKKQKRAAAATAADGEAADAGGKGFSAIGEDGLTYKQRRQMRRAAERAAKAQADAAAAENGAEAPAPAAATNGAAPNSPPDAPGGGGDATPGDDGKSSDRKKKKDKKKDKKDNTAEEATAAAPQVGNADEAARIRAVLGFTAGGGSGAAAASSLAAAFAGAAAVAAAAPSGGDGDNADVAERSAKKQKKDKKEKAEKGERGTQGDGAAAAAAAAGAAADGAGAAAGAAATSEGAKADKRAAAAGMKKQFGAGGGTQFSFDFKVQADVEAETEARVARLMALDSSKDGFVPRRVWVSGLPHEFDEDTIREYWGYCGEIESLHCLTFPDSGNFNGTAFITFKTQAGYEAALACHGEMLEGRSLRVEKCKALAELKGKARASGGAAAAAGGSAAPANGDAAKAAGGAGAAAAPGGRVPGYPVAYVGNIAFEAGAEELQALFKGAGAAPTKVRLHSDKASGRSKGYAHVHFGSDEDVDKAVALDGTNFHGRKIRVSYAQPKPGEVA